jgi:CHASE3 domain sensor protein
MLNNERQEALSSLALSANERLETAGRESASLAFNLGCSIGLLPGILVVVLVFVLAHANWLAAAAALLLSGALVLVLANLAAYTARNNVIQRTFKEQVSADIHRSLVEMGISDQSFREQAEQSLPAGATLRKFLVLEHPLEPKPPEEQV